jgi:hypothetical protein
MNISKLWEAMPQDVQRKISCHDLKRIVDNYNGHCSADQIIQALQEQIQHDIKMCAEAIEELEIQRDQYAAMLCEAMRVVYAAICAGDSTDLIDRFEALELTPANLPLNVKEHAPLSAGPHVDHGVEVKTTEDHENRAADRGCCVSTCSASWISYRRCLNEVLSIKPHLLASSRQYEMARLLPLWPSILWEHAQSGHGRLSKTTQRSR